MYKINLISIPVFLLFVLCASCKKDNSDNKPVVEPPDTFESYSALKTGNYWIYQVYEVDSNGSGAAINEFDSVYVRKDTSINGHNYYYMVSGDPNLPEVLLRDSLHYIVDNYGAILFSSEDFGTVFKSWTYNGGGPEVIAHISQKMTDRDVVFTVPAGNFITSNFRTTYEMTPNHREFGHMRYMHKRYAKNIGVISETLPFFIASPGYRERRLVRYHLN